MNRTSIVVSIARVFQKLPFSVFRFLEYPFVYLRNEYSAKEGSIIVLLALPRSGSTLTYQVLTHSIESVYLNNLGNLLYQLPFLGGSLSMARCKSYMSDFESKHGFVTGLCGPAEGRMFWSYWMGNDLDERIQSPLSLTKIQTRMRYLKNVFVALTKNKCPIVTGYLGHILQLARLKHFFPDAVYLRLRRDPLDNALSILKAWRTQGEDEWFSVFPSECSSELSSDIHRKVASQVYWLNKRLDAFNAKNMIDINYESLCKDPQLELDKLSSYCRSIGIELNKKNLLPQKFHTRLHQKSDEGDIDKLSQAFADLVNKHGAVAVFQNNLV